MVAKRRRRHEFATEEEAFMAALAKVPVSDEDPALFWGPDWEEKARQAEEDIAAGRVERHYTTEEFLASLEAATET